MKIAVCPTSFKTTLGAVAAAEAIADGLGMALPEAHLVLHPVADGGDGTLEVVHDALGGQMVSTTVTLPDQSPGIAEFLMLDDAVAVIEMARASGMAVAPGVDVMTATSKGTGQLLSAALDASPRRVIVGMGGSATVDGGMGMMQALGIGFFAMNKVAVERPADLPFLDSIDLTFRDLRLFDTEIIAACDVATGLIGPQGAVAVFGPQKGASKQQLAELEVGLARLTEVVMRTTGRWIGELPRGGAAGGCAAALYALAGAEVAPGFDLIAELTGFDHAIRDADIVIVGEGSIDAQSLLGKAPLAAARRASARGKQVWAIGGRISADPDALRSLGVTRWTETAPGEDRRAALVDAAATIAR